MKKGFLYFLTVLCLNTTQAQKPILNFPIGVQAYTFRNHFPTNVVGTLDTIKMFGITELEGNVPKGYTAEAYRKLCDESGISIPSTGVGFDELEKNLDGVIKTAKILGAKYIMCAWIPHKDRFHFNIEEAKRAVDVFNKAGKTFKENGLTFCYHDHGYEFQPYKDGTLFDYIVQNTNPEDVSFEMDVLWTLHGGADPVTLLKKYKKRWKLMHVKDLKRGIKGDGSGGTPAENDVVLGEGQANFPEILKVAKKIGIKHYFLEDESNFEMENVPKSIAFLTKIKQIK